MSVIKPGFNVGVKSNESRKKKRSGFLEDNISNRKIATAKMSSGHSWGSETGDTTESDSVDMEEEFLVEETSFDYGEGGATAGRNLKQTPKSSKIQTKRVLGKPLGKIDFLSNNDNNNILLNKPVKKLVVVRKLFSKINGFGRVFTPSKFAGIIRATFTSKLSLMKAIKLTTNAKILVNTNLKKSSGHSDQAVMVKEIPVETLVEAVCTVFSEFGLIKSVKMQLIVHSYWERCCSCVIVCFGSAESLDAVMSTTPVLRSAYLHWSYLGSAVYTKCSKVGYTFLSCASGGKISSDSSLCRVFSDADKNRLAAIYAKCLIVVGSSFPPLSVQNVLLNDDSSLEMKPTLHVSLVLNDRFAALEHSLVSLTECMDKLAKRLDAFGPTVSQLSPRWANIVISESSGVITGGKTVAGVVVFDSAVISKIEETLNNFLITVMSLSAKIDNAGSVPAIHFSQYINVSAKQKNIVCWHRKLGNLVLIVMETKLRSSCRPWIKNRFDGVQVFTSGLDADFLSAGMAIIINISLAYYVCKISEVPGWLLSIKLLFKNKLLVSILGLYAGASLSVCFAQAGEVNFLIAKTINEFSFVILGGNFNEDGSHKCASFKKCSDFGLVNSLSGSSFVRVPTWSNSWGVSKMIDYVFVFSSLANAVVHYSVLDVSEYFDTNHQAVSVSVSLSGLLDVQLNFFHKQANKNCWKFNFKGVNDAMWTRFKDASVANAAMFFDDFIAFK
ncbi:hypothetical protein G9A89_005186 [Geosiphon pyriformis]|nr:hypothetical protein G9A89_005186 [Geosiphon pyriformis]